MLVRDVHLSFWNWRNPADVNDAALDELDNSKEHHSYWLTFTHRQRMKVLVCCIEEKISFLKYFPQKTCIFCPIGSLNRRFSNLFCI